MKLSFEVKPRGEKDRRWRRPAHLIVGGENAGSPYGSSRYKGFRLCPFEQGLSRVAKLRPKRQHEALDVGWLFHLGLETYYSQLLATDGGNTASVEGSALDALAPLAEEPRWAETVATASNTLAGYFDHYRGRDSWRILAVEETLEHTEGVCGEHAGYFCEEVGCLSGEMHFGYSARLDLIIEDMAPHRRGLWIVEHKTAHAITEDLLHGYQLDQQILGQVWLLQQCIDLEQLPPFRGVVVNIATKHKTTRCERADVCPSPEHLAAFEASVRQWWDLENVYRRVGYPKALGSCSGALRGYSRCQYYALCQGKPSWSVQRFAEEEPPYGFYREGEEDGASWDEGVGR